MSSVEFFLKKVLRPHFVPFGWPLTGWHVGFTGKTTNPSDYLQTNKDTQSPLLLSAQPIEGAEGLYKQTLVSVMLFT